MATIEAASDDAFLRLAEPFRPELLAHCARMLGSIDEAADLVQETYVRAWRSYDRFEGQASLRTWLHRIATRACLTALERRRRRPLPTGLGHPSSEPGDALVEHHEVPWLEPLPDALIERGQADPALIAGHRTSIRLAFIAALQHLPPRQRAALLLHDVLKWRAAEVATALEVTVTAVNGLLQRARAGLDRAAPAGDEIVEPTAAEQRELLDRYVTAFEHKDVAALVKLFTADVVWEMPPFTSWFTGAHAVGRHLTTTCPVRPGEIRLLPTKANGQPAYALYVTGEAVGLQVLTLTPAGISHAVMFGDIALLPHFALPLRLVPSYNAPNQELFLVWRARAR